MTKFLKIALGNLLVLGVLLVVVEVVLRIANIGGYGSAPMNPDPVFHHVHPVDYQFISYSSVGDFDAVEVSYDHAGLIRAPQFRNEKVPALPASVAFLGDSFVESNQVAFDSSFIGRLQLEFPQVEMLNFGVSSYSPVLHYLLAKHRLVKLSPPPSKVFIMLYSNDVRDDENYLADASFDASGNLEAVNGGAPNWLLSFMRRLHLARLLRKAQVTLKFMLQEKKPEEAKAVVGDHLEENPDWEGTQSAAYTLRTVRLLEDQGIQTYLTVVPSKYSHFFQDYEQEEFSEKVGQWAAKNSVDFIDLTEPFRQWRSTHEGSLFFEKDIHFNSTGHKIVAEALKPYAAIREAGVKE